MSRQAHIVRRQSLEFDIAPGQDAHRLQEQIRQIFFDKVVPIMDAVMSERVAEHELLRIDRLELDLGLMDVTRLDEQFAERIREQLDQALSSELGRAARPNARHMDVASDDRQGHPQLVRLEQSDLQLLAYYLRTGLLPWWSRDDLRFNLEISLDRQLEQHPERLRQALHSLPPRRIAARLSRQVSQPMLERLIQALAVPHSDRLAGQLGQILAIFKREAGQRAARVTVLAYEFLIDLLLRSRPTMENDAQRLLTQLVQRLVRDSQIDAASLYRRLTLMPERDLSIDPQILQWLKQQAEASGEVVPEVQVAGTSKAGTQSLADPKAATDSAPSPASGQHAPLPEDFVASTQSHTTPINTASSRTDVAQDTSTFSATEGVPLGGRVSDADVRSDLALETHTDLSSDELAELELGAFLNNAGLVLLWPYLPRFFQAVGLADSRDFLGGHERERGVRLLQYLVSGETEFPEHELLLNKLLCGWPLLDPVLCGLDIREREKHEADELLDSVVGHWRTLKNTSSDGFREAFLRREGRLSHDDMGWQLKVNRAGVDVLLESLPWGIGLIRLPWMPDALRVEW